MSSCNNRGRTRFHMTQNSILNTTVIKAREIWVLGTVIIKYKSCKIIKKQTDIWKLLGFMCLLLRLITHVLSSVITHVLPNPITFGFLSPITYILPYLISHVFPSLITLITHVLLAWLHMFSLVWLHTRTNKCTWK